MVQLPKTKTRVDTKDWQNLPLERWNATTYREYLKHLHRKRYGIPYVTNNHAIEGRFLKNTWEEYGKLALKRFIEICFDEYKPTAKYPGLNFGFMYSYMRARIMPRVLKELSYQKKVEKKAKRHQTANANQMTEEELRDWI